MISGWEIPDVFFSAAQQRAAHEVLDRDLGGSERIGLAYLSGSLAVGLGHSTSDIDLYAVSDGAAERQMVYRRNDLTVHAMLLRPELVNQIADLGSAYRATMQDPSQLNLDIRIMHGLVRLVAGWRMVCSPDWAATLNRMRRDVIRQILISRNAIGFADLAEDVAGALDIGDLPTAAHASGLALQAAAEALLAAADDLYLGPKFLFRRLGRNAVTRAWAPTLWRLVYQAFSEREAQDRAGAGAGAGGDAAADELGCLRRTAELRLRVGGLLLSWCAVEGWVRPLDELPAPLDTGHAAAPAVSSRSPYFVPVRFADRLMLIGPGEDHEVDEATVQLWRGGAAGSEPGYLS